MDMPIRMPGIRILTWDIRIHLMAIRPDTFIRDIMADTVTDAATPLPVQWSGALPGQQSARRLPVAVTTTTPAQAR